MKIHLAKWIALTEQTIQSTNFGEIDVRLKWNWCRLRELKDHLDYIYHVMYLQQKYDKQSFNDRMIVENVVENLGYWSEVSKALSIEFCKAGHPTIYDVKNVLEIFLRATSLEQSTKQLDLDEDVMKFIQASFKKFTDTSKENKKFNTLDKAFGIANYVGKHHTKSVNPFKIPAHVKKTCKLIMVDNKSLTKIMDDRLVPKGDTQLKKDWASHKWNALSEFLYRLCWDKQTGKGAGLLTTQQLGKIKSNWDIELPSELEIFIRPNLSPKLYARIDLIKGGH